MICTSQGVSSLPVSLSWRPSLVATTHSEYIVLDFASHRELEIRQAVAASAPSAILAWEGPFRSPGSTNGMHRATLFGHVDADLSGLDIRLTIMSLRALRPLSGTLIGRHGLFADPASRLIDFRSVAALVEVEDLVDEIVFASSRLAVVSTMAKKAEWTDKLTAIASADAEEAIEMVRNRPSAGGRAWAKPACRVATPPQTLAARAGVVCGRPTALFKVRGPFGPRPHEVLGVLMQRAAERVGMAWVEVAADAPLSPAQWHHRLNHRGVVSGRMALCLASDAELRVVVDALADAVVDFVGSPTLLTMEALYAQGNSQVGRGGPGRG